MEEYTHCTHCQAPVLAQEAFEWSDDPYCSLSCYKADQEVTEALEASDWSARTMGLPTQYLELKRTDYEEAML